MWAEGRFWSIARRSVLLTAACIPAGAGTAVARQDLYVTINPAWDLTAPGSLSLAHGQTAFQPFQGTATVRYEARTTQQGGGAITLQMGSDFQPGGGPSVGKGVLTYTCQGATEGTPCSGAQTASTSNQTPVVTLPGSVCTGGGRPCSGQDPDSVSLTFTLIDDPGYATGVYSANVIFIISAI